MKPTIVSIIGARPQFIKAAATSQILRTQFQEIIIHTGQHYNVEMSGIFFEQLNIPKPDYNLGIGSATHGVQTGEMLKKLDPLLSDVKPSAVMVYGDTNSTLAGALTAAKLMIPVIHVESGLRSFNRNMPEEINRVVTDRLSTILFSPTPTAVLNLKKEGIVTGVYHVGDIMNDILQQMLPIAKQKSAILKTEALQPHAYYLCTIHRAENTDSIEHLESIFSILFELTLPVVLPLHPRTEHALTQSLKKKIASHKHIKLIKPVNYLDMLMLEASAQAILTDSGGVQKEAYALKTPCITLREETEWIETLQGNWNVIVGNNKQKALDALHTQPDKNAHDNVFGSGDAAQQMVNILHEHFTK
jgi:UDP-N-acetylglucosamine 2-epimerase